MAESATGDEIFENATVPRKITRQYSKKITRSSKDEELIIKRLSAQLNAESIDRVQEADGGFFESYSALLWKRENKRLQTIREEETKKEAPPPTESSVGIETPHYDISRKERDQLYITVLYTIKNQIGSRPVDQRPSDDDLYRYAQEAFNVSSDEHQKFLEIAEKEQPPILVLNVTVIEAQGLEAKDPNGFSDPFCMLGIQPGSSLSCMTTSNNSQLSNVDTVEVEGNDTNPEEESKFKKHHSDDLISTTMEGMLPSDYLKYDDESMIDGDSTSSTSTSVFSHQSPTCLNSSSSSSSPSYSSSSNSLQWFHVWHRYQATALFLSSFKLSFKRKDKKSEKEHRDSLSNDIPARYICATTVKPHTLNPTWDEKFTFNIDDINSDRLHLDIWDNDDESSVLEAVRQLNQVQSWKGLGRYFKQVAQSARSHGSYNVDDFLGCISIPLYDLPSTGIDRWYDLQGRSHRSTVQGRIRLKLTLTTRDRSTRGVERWWEAREQEQMLHFFIEHQTAKLGDDIYKWKGDLGLEASTILHQHAVQGDLTELQQAVCYWKAYSQKHMQHSFDYAFLYQLLQRLNHCWNTESLAKDEELSLADSFSQFVDFLLILLKKQRDLFPPMNRAAYYKLDYLLRCLALINEMNAFWRCCPFHKEINLEIVNAIKKGTAVWYESMYALTRPQVKTNDSILNSFIDLTNILNVDLHYSFAHYAKLFKSTIGVSYFVVAYKQLDKMVEDDVKPAVEKLCAKIKENVDVTNDPLAEGLTMGTAMFELYLALQEFAKFKENLSPTDRRGLAVAGFHEWFSGALLRWLSIARFKAMLRIRKAVEIDRANQVDTGVKLSTSAVDTTACFYQIKDFWKQLAWVDLVTAYTFVFKILDDICNGATYYGDLIHQKLRDVGYFDNEGQFDVTEELCLTINNIEHVRMSMKALPDELDFQSVFLAIEKTEGEVYGNQCRNSLDNMLKSADEDVTNKIIHVVQRVGEKMRPDLKKYVFHLTWAPDALPADDAIVPLMEYLDSNLTTLNHNLLRANFERILEVIWLVVIEEMKVQATSGIGEKQPVFFNRLHEACNMLIEFFHAEQKGLPIDRILCKSYQDFDNLLSLHRSETDDLIAQYFIKKLEDQKNMESREFGSLTVKVYFHHDCLFVEVLHARDVIALDPNGFSDPFVIIELQPQHVFPDCPHQQTKVQKKTLHPLFDECFEYSVSLDQCTQESSVVSFTVMDHDIMLSNDFAGEAYFSLNDAPGVKSHLSASEIPHLKAIELILMRPKYKENAILTTLEKRIWDKTAQDFAKKKKSRMI